MDVPSIDVVEDAKMAKQADETISRKKRLSRKEQKARRKKQKQKHNHSQPDAETTTPGVHQPVDKISDSVPNHETKDFMSNYSPISIPTQEHDEEPEKHNRSLGKWFPKAVVIKPEKKEPVESLANKKCCLVLFYQYVPKEWSEQRVNVFMSYLSKVAKTRQGLGGRIRVAPEGINATVSALSEESPERLLRHFCQDLIHFDPIYKETDFKFIPDLDASRHFKELRILPVKELVFYGITEKEAPKGGVHLKPADFHEKLEKDNTVVIDVRNHYEAAIGRFDGQERSKCGGAEYIDPKMRKSTDFTSWLSQDETKAKLEGKNVMMFCTGGIRCERASAHLQKQMGDSVQGVYQLKGGIEAYLKTFPQGGHWRGKNYVFDKREAISATNRNGDGGVIEKQSSAEAGVGTVCCVCGKPWDRYVGKKKCDTCGVPVLMCDVCMSYDKKKKKKQQKDDEHKSTPTRCPLCVEENITVLASQVEYTDNGVSGRLVNKTTADEKVAASVLKWGGGHATAKKEKRRMKRKPCKFGVDCIRKDCFFSHPSEWKGSKS